MSLNKSVQFKVNGIHCGSCAGKIKKSLEETNIEHSVEINVEKGEVCVKFNSEQGTVANLKDSIIKVGFQVEKIELN
jgi:copper chaperone